MIGIRSNKQLLCGFGPQIREIQKYLFLAAYGVSIGPPAASDLLASTA